LSYLDRGNRVGVLELRECRADNKIAEQSRIVKRSIRLGEPGSLALRVGDVADDEGLKLVAEPPAPGRRRLRSLRTLGRSSTDDATFR
jgi:hypothetical protein